MPCMSKLNEGGNPVCRIFRAYGGNPKYHGELCEGCPDWEDSEADFMFKFNLPEFYGLDYKAKTAGKSR